MHILLLQGKVSPIAAEEESKQEVLYIIIAIIIILVILFAFFLVLVWKWRKKQKRKLKAVTASAFASGKWLIIHFLVTWKRSWNPKFIIS